MALLRRITLIIMSVAALATGVMTPVAPAFASGAQVPTLSSPADDPSVALKDVVLKWQPVSGASLYQVEVSPNINFTNNKIVLDGDGKTVNTLFELPVSLPHTTYYWHVRAQVAGTWSDYSSPWRFLREWDAPLTILQQPTTADPTISWAAVPEASLYRVDFFLIRPQFPDDAPILSCYTDETTYTPHSLAAQTPAPPLNIENGAVPFPNSAESCGGTAGLKAAHSYYWRVNAYDDTQVKAIAADTIPNIDSACDQLPECDARTLNTTAGGPFLYQPPTPAIVTATTVTGLKTTWHAGTNTQNTCTADTACPMTPTFSWDPVPNASCYIVKVYRDPGATNLYWAYSTPWPTLTPQDAFLDAQPGQPYVWRVYAPSDDNCSDEAPTTCPAVVAPQGTTVVPPAISDVSAAPAGPGGSSTAQGGTTVTVTLTGSGFQSGACVESTAGTITGVAVASASKITFSYAAPAGGGVEQFFVHNPDSGVSGESPDLVVAPAFAATSALVSFDKRTPQIALSQPAPGATEHGATFTFSWGDFLTTASAGGYEARNYELEVNTDPTFVATPVFDSANIDLTQFTPTAAFLKNGHYYWRVAPIDEAGNVLTWSNPQQFSVNATGPTVSFTVKNGVGIMHPLTISLSEAAKGVSGRTLRVVPAGSPASDYVHGKLTIGTSPKQYVFTPSHPFATGGRYHLWVSPALVDANGNPAQVGGNPIRVTKKAKSGSRGWTYSSGWKRYPASSALSGHYAAASSGATATLIVAGDEAQLYGCKGPGMGTIKVSIAGNTQRVSEHQAFTRCGIEIWHSAIPDGENQLKVSVVGGTGTIDEVKVT